MMRLSRTRLTTPLGDMLALASDQGLCALEFIRVRSARGTANNKKSDRRLSRLDARLRRWFPPHVIVDGEPEVIARTRTWLTSYFEGTSAEVGDLPLDVYGAEFEKRVWRALLRIPPGETRSYGAIATQLGSAHAARAVGAANGANPIAIVVPCHRVIGSSGSLTGYGGGLERKSWLLEHERRWRSEPQRSLFDVRDEGQV
jgi:O-6-methylguanine DNA methyltransferase